MCGEVGTVGLGDGLDDGQAEPVSVGVADSFAADLLERLEEPLDLAGGTTGPVLLTVMVARPGPEIVEISTASAGDVVA